MREKLLVAWGKLSARYPGRIIAALIILSVIALFSASKLTLKMRWSDLLPFDDPMVQEFDEIQKEYTGTTNSIMVVRGPEKQIKKFADEIVPPIRKMTRYVKRVNYKLEVDFFRTHGLMLSRTPDLKKMVDNKLFADLSLAGYLSHVNDNFEAVYIGDRESLSDKEKEDLAISSLDGLQYWIKTMRVFVSGQGSDSLARVAVSRLLIGDPYYISPDKRMLLVIIDPNFDVVDIKSCIASTDSIQVLIDNLLEKFPSVSAGLTGMIPLSRDEMTYANEDMGRSSLLAFLLVIFLFIFSFRMISAPLLAGFNLIIGIIIATGVIGLLVGSLNIMTLIGLGIDFSIHIISLYYERRAKGETMEAATVYALSRSGAGIITGALTTAAAFLTLMISRTRGISEMGLVLGTGVVMVMIVALLLLPALLVAYEKIANRLHGKNKPLRNPPVSVQFAFMGNVGARIKKRPGVVLFSGIILTAVLLFFALKIKFDYNYLNMEPKGIPSVALQDSMLNAFSMSPDFVMITAPTVDSIRVISDQAKKVQSVSIVESISNYIPSRSQQAARAPLILRLRTQLKNAGPPEPISERSLERLITQLNRLDMNIYEFGQMAYLGGQDRVDAKCREITGDPDSDSSRSIIQDLIGQIKQNSKQAVRGLNSFQAGYMPRMRAMALAMTDTASITVQNLPRKIRERYINKKGNKFLATIFPRKQVWDFKFLRRFTEQMERISSKITGTPPLFLKLIDMIGRDGRRASLLALLVVFFLLWFDFGKIKLTLIAMIPLLAGAVWMVGLLSVLGLPLTFVNVMAVPMIIGIGVDDGVHLMHRYRIEGWSRTRRVLTSTGKAILLTSLTTIAGFGSLLIARYRGFVSLGTLLILGVVSCFITTVLFLPAIVNLLKEAEQSR